MRAPSSTGMPRRAQFPGRGRVHGGGDVGQHRERLAGPPRDFGEGVLIGPVAVELGHQVHRERDRRDGRVVGQRGERLGELPLRLGARAPHVQRVARLQARIEHLGQPPQRGLADRAERHAQFGGQVGDVRPFQAGVVHRGDPAAPPRRRPPPDREQLKRVGQLRQVGDPVHAVGVRERLPCPVRAGQRPGMRGHQRAPGRGTSRRQQHHRNLPNGCRLQHLLQRTGVPHRLKHQGEHPGLRQVQRIPRVLGRRGDQFLAGGDRHGVPERPAGAQHRGEHRTGLGDQRDRARRKLVRLGVPDRPQPVAHVDEAHAASAAQGHPGGARRRGDPVPERDRGSGAGPGSPEPGSPAGTGSCAPPKITADLSPRRAARSTCAASAASGTPSSTRSTGRGRAASEGWHGTPPISRYFGLIRYIAGEAGLRATSATIRWPSVPGRGLAPTRATLRASSIARRAGCRPAPGGARSSAARDGWAGVVARSS